MLSITRRLARAQRSSRWAQSGFGGSSAPADRHMAAEQRARAKQRAAACVAEAEALTLQIQKREMAIDTLLRRALGRKPAEFATQDISPPVAGWRAQAPLRAALMPQQPGAIAALIPGVTARYRQAVRQAEARFAVQETEHRKHTARRAAAADGSQAQASLRAVAAREPEAVSRYFLQAIEYSVDDEADASSAHLSYARASGILVVDLHLPALSAIPAARNFRYNKQTDTVEPFPRHLANRRLLYSRLIDRVALKCIDTVFRADLGGAVECLLLNGALDARDPTTGTAKRICLVSVRVTAARFRELDLRQVDAGECLRSLEGTVSKNPGKMLSVVPLARPDMDSAA